MDYCDRRVTGYKKQQGGLACEDAVLVREVGDFIIMACADGHGDRRCRFADRGAELAVYVALSELEAVCRECDGVSEAGERLNDGRTALYERIISSWICAVLDDYLVRHPSDKAFAQRHGELCGYSAEMFKVRDEKIPVREFRRLAEYRHNIEKEIHAITHLYGTTLNAAVVTREFVFAVGIGDGDVVAVNGKRVEWLLPYSPRFGTGTSSLGGIPGSVIDRFSSILVPIVAGRRITESRFLPELVMISTDGLRNAFLSDDEFAEKLLEIAALMKRGEGYSFVKASKQWLEERTRLGVTQDDISFCLATRHSLRRKKRRKDKA